MEMIGAHQAALLNTPAGIHEVVDHENDCARAIEKDMIEFSRKKKAPADAGTKRLAERAGAGPGVSENRSLQPVNTEEKLAQVIKGREVGQIEVGSPYVGIETHHSSIQLNRISFYYPVANSIDVSKDYWNRGDYPVLTFGLKVGDRAAEKIGDKPFDCTLTPYSAVFERKDREKTVAVSYRFCKDKPAMVMEMEITNNSGRVQELNLDSCLETSIRTSSTFARLNKPVSRYDAKNRALYATYEEPETRNAVIFAANAGDPPSGYSAENKQTGNPAAAFHYRKTLKPGEKMKVIQVTGSCRKGEEEGTVRYLLGNYQREIALYEQSILDKVHGEGRIETGIAEIDTTALWAKGILAANAHYIDGQIRPMPCPAEYNFYFTHDALLTDLAAVNFDLPRVKRDLLYTALHANSQGIIPHARYWKDDHFETEYAGRDNWNHFWFLNVSARYLRHSGDVDTLKRLYPLLRKSVTQSLINKHDDLIWAHRPDWWDIGNSFGPRTYMTVLAIRSLREFAYVSTVLGKDAKKIKEYEDMADRMQEKLEKKLWDKDRSYLMNYFSDGKKDTHYYTGSLLAAHFGLLDGRKKEALVNTARSKLLQEDTGIYNVYPMDFHTLGDYLHFSGNEAGDPYRYMNGGIWYHGNAWYALALIAAGRKEDALKFIQDIMTLEGIKSGPHGQPAMYECRNGNSGDPEVFGEVDKPHFLWAGSWYLYSLYNLFGHHENEWNISFDPFLANGQKGTRYTVSLKGRPVTVDITGSGRYIRSIRYDGAPCPSAVVPEGPSPGKKVEITLGAPETPYLASAGSMVHSPRFDPARNTMELSLSAFPGHSSEAKFISPHPPKSLAINGNETKEGWSVKEEDGVYRIRLNFTQKHADDVISVQFQEPSVPLPHTGLCRTE
ncbi:MAG: amylo-alpha-1,6-glucosidase [Candidatus Eremiobacteraeota bacterium]|nr:amylo-alpha-1,6-glucosidase [Candidatus Eremiobacteraeota bacterium]